MTLDAIAFAWTQFFFAPVPVYPVAVFRMLLGAILLYDAVVIACDADTYLGPRGIVSYERYFVTNRGQALSLFLYMPANMRSVHAVLVLHVAALAMMTIGFLTPLATAIAFITTRSIVNRSAPSCNGGDNVAKIMLFLLIFTPAGHAFSVDEILFLRPADPSGGYLAAPPWAQRLMMIQVSIIYLYTVYWKLKGETWRAGSAVHYAISNVMYRKYEVPRMLRRPAILRAATWGVLVAEVMVGVGIWVEDTRVLAVALGFVLHLTIETFLSVHLFGWYMIACLCLFLDWSWLGELL